MPRIAPSPRAIAILLSFGCIAASLALNPVSAAADSPVPDITAVGVGYEHTCALTASGGVLCWGGNQLGQLGNGTDDDTILPVDVTGLTSGVAAIAAGNADTCAVTTSGGAKCWGSNSAGELGDGTNVARHAPVDVSGLTSGVAAISAGNDHTCAVTTTGGAKCWGYNSAGELGDGTNVTSYTPVNVSGLTSGVSQIAVGQAFTCAVTISGGAKCWGANYAGNLGNGTKTSTAVPVDVSGLSTGVAAIAVDADHACALTTSGGVKCWGRNNAGQLGDGTTTDRLTPVDVSGLTSGVSSISTGAKCAVTTSGGAKCWGSSPGDGTELNSSIPVDVSGLTSGVAAISSDPGHTCAVTVAGGGECWGFNRFAQLGDGTTITRFSPVALFAPIVESIDTSVTKVDASGDISLTTTWSGLDPYARITAYQAQIQTYNGKWNDVALTHPAGTKFTLILDPYKRYSVQIRALDKLGRWGAWSESSFIPKTAQESSASYSAGWGARSNPGFWDGTVQRTQRVGSLVLFDFHGRNLEWIGPVGPGYGTADVYMDGTYVATVDCHATVPGQRRVLFRSGPLASRAHSVEIINRGARIDIDGFVWFK